MENKTVYIQGDQDPNYVQINFDQTTSHSPLEQAEFELKRLTEDGYILAINKSPRTKERIIPLNQRALEMIARIQPTDSLK